MPTTSDTVLDPGSVKVLDPGQAWRLHPRVAVRPEPFGALLYHFGTRRLSFLKEVRLVGLVTTLGDYPSVEEAFDALAIPDRHRPGYVAALQRLVETDMLSPAERNTP